MIVECPSCTRRYDVSGRPPGTVARCACGGRFTLPEPPGDAGSIACPGCGAGVASTSQVCTYCDRPLQVRACPRCFGALFDGVKFCGHCGADATAPARALANGKARPRDCPRCPSGPRLESQLVCEVALDACPECEGVFVDNDLLERLLVERRHAPRQDEAAGQDRARRGRAWVGAGAEGRGRSFYIRCPDCGGNMLRRNFGRTSGVVVDICEGHGTWFDADELEAVIEFVQAGGLDDARRTGRGRFGTGRLRPEATPGMAAPPPEGAPPARVPSRDPDLQIRITSRSSTRRDVGSQIRVRHHGMGFFEDALGAISRLLL